MQTKQEKKTWSINKAKELSSKLDSILSEKLTTNEGIDSLMKYYRISGLYRYSFYNSLLIMTQGGEIAQSYNNWKKLKRTVKHGEKSFIRVFTPIIGKEIDKKTGEKVDKLFYFALKPVFDYKQTKGDDLQFDANSNISTDVKFDDILSKIKNLTKKNIVFKMINGARGFCSDTEIIINSISNDTDKIRTLIHETAHDLFNHVGDNKDTDVKELEAESVSNLILSFLGIKHEFSRSYIDNWKIQDNAEMVNKKKIISITEKMIKAITN